MALPRPLEKRALGQVAAASVFGLCPIGKVCISREVMSGCGGAMRTISDFLARKGVASASFPSPASAKILPGGAEERSELTFADIGARIGEDDEKLRNLLIDTDRRMGALDDLKEAFRNLVEPIASPLPPRQPADTKNFCLLNVRTT